VQLAEGALLGLEVGGDLVGDRRLGEVGGGHPDRRDQVGVQVGQQVPLVTVDALALVLRPWRIWESWIEIRRSRVAP